MNAGSPAAKDPYRYFRIEARELIDTLSRGVVDLGAHDDADRRRTLMRASHTLKGAAGVVRHEEIARLAHQLEDLLTANAATDTLLPIVDAMNTALAALSAPRDEKATPVTSNAPAAPVASESVRLDLADVDTLLASLADLGARVGALRSKSGISLEAALESVERLAHDALEDARRLRLLPAETLFAEISRAAHDAAAHEGRLIELETFGGNHRLDAHVLGLVRDALLQMVRNAIAHGIEPAAERARTAKPKAGRITLRVEVHGQRARLSIKDDGRGLDVAAMRAAIVLRKLRSTEEAERLDATGLLEVAMRAGVSTRTTASELAGRGVGLQVVASALDRLRATLHVTSTPGLGTEIALDVPVSMTAAPALTVEAGAITATIPLDAVIRTERVTASDIIRSADGDVLPSGERFAALGRLFGDAPARETWTTIVLDGAAVGVDRILGIANAIVMPLPPAAISGPVVAGASLDGEGNPRLALEPRTLVELVKNARGAPQKAKAEAVRRILVTDDSLTSRMLEQSILEAAGYDVSTATSGEEALDKARGAPLPFHLFVIDVEMGAGMTGFETVARMRADPKLANIPAVLVTSRAAPEDRRRGLEAGARAYIVKGEFAQTEFLETVKRLIG